MKLLAITAALTLPLAASADEIEDALSAAAEAYQDGDIAFALQELDFARAKLNALKTDELVAFLPEAPDGWTREIDTEVAASLGLMGGGSGASAIYFDGAASQEVTVTIMADSPMVTGMGAMVANAGAMGLPVERIGRQTFALQDDQLMGLVANRVLVTAEGADVETLKSLLEGMDFRALAGWGL
ncbi:MAG: hypothetical protein AAGA15_12775 [Pseudomonadota bacterium]